MSRRPSFGSRTWAMPGRTNFQLTNLVVFSAALSVSHIETCTAGLVGVSDIAMLPSVVTSIAPPPSSTTRICDGSSKVISPPRVGEPRSLREAAETKTGKPSNVPPFTPMPGYAGAPPVPRSAER